MTNEVMNERTNRRTAKRRTTHEEGQNTDAAGRERKDELFNRRTGSGSDDGHGQARSDVRHTCENGLVLWTVLEESSAAG